MKLIRNIILLCLVSGSLFAEDKKKVPKVDELTEAYQREILFLSSYKKELVEKKEAMQASLGRKVKEATAELDQMETKWLKMQASNEILMQRLGDIERDFENREENRELLQTTLKQAELSEGEKKVEELGLLENLKLTFDQALVSLNNSTEVTSQPGKFYDKSGQEQEGQIIALGSVAKFADKNGKVASLYPSGGGHFRVWSWLDASSGALKNGKIPETLSFFLYENPDKEFTAQKEKTWMDTMKAGGLIGWVILVMGVFALIISGVRMALLNKAEPKKTQNLEEALSRVRENDLDGAQHILLSENNAVGRVLSKTLSFLRSEPQKVEDAIMEAILKESKIIDRFGVVILVIASVAPLMGLLGTVTGMISTFDIITLYGTGNPKLLSGGISEALVTTMFGLIVAIPALLIGQFLSAKTEGIKSDMEKWALATCNAFKNRGDKVS